MALIEIDRITTIFGPHPKRALSRLSEGVSKAELLQATQHTLALHDVSFEVRKGEIFVVMGLSGSGKSTLVRHINRLVDPTSGTIRVAGADVMQMRGSKLIEYRRQRVSMVFQGFGLFPHRTVLDNVAFGLEAAGVAARDRKREATRWIEQVGLSGFELQYPAQLSGGMQQRVGLARALCCNTDIILMDEAFSALDPLIRAQLQGDLLRLQADLGKTVVFITHDLDEALRLGSRIAILKDGRLVQVATPREILVQPADDYVAAFVRDVNRARALKIGAAVEAFPAGQPLPSPELAVDAETSIEELLVRLVGRRTPLPVKRNGQLVGQVSLDAVRDLLLRQEA